MPRLCRSNNHHHYLSDHRRYARTQELAMRRISKIDCYMPTTLKRKAADKFIAAGGDAIEVEYLRISAISFADQGRRYLLSR